MHRLRILWLILAGGAALFLATSLWTSGLRTYGVVAGILGAAAALLPLAAIERDAKIFIVVVTMVFYLYLLYGRYEQAFLVPALLVAVFAVWRLIRWVARGFTAARR